ncbi:MAG: OmpH family outer membrane protein [Chitinophagales bacterium]|nr:OmpH family outer membrane protein [Chitinophagales bacterium]MDW8418658.1 OmpH family outer membrane protein [Chitinophagales bacterium]
MKKALSTLLAVCIICTITSTAQQRYGHINSDEIRDAMPEYKQLVASMRRARQERESRLKAMYADYQKKMIELSEYQFMLMEAVLEEKNIELMNLQASIQEFEQKIEPELAQMQMRRLKPLNDKYLKIVNQVAQENGYDFIFDVATGHIAYYPENEGDITELVKKKMGIQ